MASGCDVAGIDPDGFARDAAASAGILALDESGDATTDQVLSWSRGRGADAVLVCAAGQSPQADVEGAGAVPGPGRRGDGG